MDIDELDEFDLQEIEAALYAKIHHEIYEECSGPTGEASSTALSSSCVTESYTAEDNFVAVQSHTAGHFRSLEEDAIYIIEEGSKYSVQSKCISSSSKATTVILSDSDEDIVCISANESNKNVIHIDSDSDVSIIPTEVNKDKPSVMKTRTGVSSFYKKKDDDPLTSGERSFLRLHFGFEKDKTELAKNKKKKQHVVFESDSDEEIHMRDITNLDSDISLNIEGTLASEHTNILRKIDAIVNQSVFVEQQDGEGDRVPRSWTDDMKQFYNNTKDLCDIDMAIRQLPKDKELWKIDPADKYKDFRRNRYFNTYKGRCSNCNQVGHPFRECPDPIKPIICSMCGGVGHNRFQCQRALCLQCGTRTPKYQEMCSRCRHDLRIICCICKMQGHGPVRCPDVWRRYHLSTEPGHVLAPCTPPQRLIVRKTGCCNCASKHHSVSSCPSRRESVLPLHLNETIFSYENPFCYDSEIPTIFKRKIDDEQIKEVDEPRKVVGNQDCDIAPRCVHYKIIDTYSLKFRKCIYDEVKKIWPTIALGKCPKRSSNSNTYLIHGIHIDGASRKIKKKVASYLENAFSFLRSISLTQGRKAVSQNMDSLVVENREALLNEHIRESPEWKELFYSLDRHVQAVTSRTAVKKKKMKKEKRIQHQHLFK